MAKLEDKQFESFLLTFLTGYLVCYQSYFEGRIVPLNIQAATRLDTLRTELLKVLSHPRSDYYCKLLSGTSP